MAVYDDDKKQDLNALTPQELGALEDKYSTPSDQKEDEALENNPDDSLTEDVTNKFGRGGMGRKLRKHREEEDAKEPDVNEGFQKGLAGAKEKDKQAGLFKDDDDADTFLKKAMKKGRGLAKNKKFVVGAAGGLIGLIVAITSIGGFFNLFKLDHILQNIDSKTFSRFNASFADRSDRYTRAYMQLRLSEADGEFVNGKFTDEDRFFRSRNIDTGNPIRDYYRTLRASKFEADLAKNGIVLESRAVTLPDGSINNVFASVKVNGEEIDVTPKGVRAGDLEAYVRESGNRLDTEIFKTNKAARKEIRKAVNDNTRFYRVIKRRHLRKDIANMTGITKWSFFETSVDKFREKHCDGKACKAYVETKIYQKILPDTNTGKFLKCILGAGACPSNNDPENPENKLGGDYGGAPIEGDTTPTDTVTDADGHTAVDADGKPITSGEFGAGSTVDDIEGAIGNATNTEVTEAFEGLTPAQRFMKFIFDKFGLVYTKIWSVLKQIAKIHNALKSGALTRLVYNARTVMFAGYYATMAISRDQIRSGELTGGELNAFMQTVGNIDHSEGWMMTTGKTNDIAAAAELTHVPRKDYCKLSDAKKLQNNVLYNCENLNESNAKTGEDWYRNSALYDIIDPIAAAVDAITSTIGGVFDIVTGFFDQVTEILLEPVISALFSAVQDNLSTVITAIIGKIFIVLGAGPPNFATDGGNIMVAGSAVTAENSTRSSGGVASTPTTLAYTSQLAADYQKEELQDQSLFTRYASLSNHHSVLSNLVYGGMNLRAGNRFSGIINSFANLPNVFADLFSGRAFAATDSSGAALAQWAGVKTYDIPPQCEAIDPLDESPDVTKVLGVIPDAPRADEAQAVLNDSMPEITIETARNVDKFWPIIYSHITDKVNSEEIATAIYNCASFDARVMGGNGYLYGYDSDYGLDPQTVLGGGVGTPTSPVLSSKNLFVVGDSLTVGMRDTGSLEDKLKAAGWATVTTVAESGRTLDWGLQQLKANEPALHNSGAVLVGLGTNNDGAYPGGMDQFKQQVQAIVDYVRSPAVNPAMVIYWTDFYGKGTYNGINLDNAFYAPDGLNAALTTIAGASSVKVNHWSTSDVASQFVGFNELHPYGHYQEMADFIIKEMGPIQ